MSNKAIFGLAAAASFLAVSAAFAADAAAVPAASSYAAELNVTGDVTATVSGTTVKLSWASVTGATSYQAQYDEKQPDLNDVNSAYAYAADFAASEGATATGEIANLKPSTKYYLIVSAFDAQGRESDVASTEISFTTEAAAAVSAPASTGSVAAAFGLDGAAVTTVDATTIRLSFNADLDAAKDVSVSVVSNLDKSDLGATAVADPTDAKSAVVTLATPMALDSSYALTVKAATDAAGRSIPAGTDAVREFTYAVASSTGSAATSTVVSAADTAAPVALNAAPAATAAASGKLPATGPAETVVVLMALALAGAYAMLRRSRA